MTKAKETAARPAAETPPDALRRQRDRFVGFAFAAGELLLEIDAEDRVAWAGGLAEALCGGPEATLKGRRLADLSADGEAHAAEELIARLRSGQRVRGARLDLRAAGGTRTPCRASGLTDGSGDGTVRLALTRDLSIDRKTAAAAVGPDEFGKALKTSVARGRTTDMTLLDLECPFSGEEADEFLASVEGLMRAWSHDGSGVGRLADGKYGVLHDGGLDEARVRGRILDIAHGLDPDIDVKIVSARVDLDAAALKPEDLDKAVAYTLAKFVKDGGEGFSVKSLADGCKGAVDEALGKVSSFRSTLTQGRLVFAYQAIVGLNKWEVHHYEALARIQVGDRLALPAKLIGFAEDIGVVHELDMFVCRRALEVLEKNVEVTPDQTIAVNLSGRSMCNAAFVSEMLLLLNSKRHLLGRLMFEVTESAEIRSLEEADKTIQSLRRLGCPVCLDDFGAGAAAFTYLRALGVDHVKIDGSYILDAFTTKHGGPFIRAIGALCAEMGIGTIGEMVEDERSARLLLDSKVECGQGYYFSRPLPKAAGFRLPIKPDGLYGAGKGMTPAGRNARQWTNA